MSNETIIEGNKLIAEFMGLQRMIPNPIDNPTDDPTWIIGLKNNGKFAEVFSDQLAYHASWDWLMPVVERVRNAGSIIEISFCLACSTKIWNRKPGWHIVIEDNESIKSVWQAVVEFIQWYNENKKEATHE